MPMTVNGIGTHYYGNKNRQTRAAQCRSCGYAGQLASYDTRLWFVVFFIPIVPLGRKRILDSCPRCRRHFVAKADAFAMASQLSTSEALEQFHNRPTAESALEAHARMLGFHQHAEAKALREEALSKFPADAVLMSGMARHLDQVSDHAQANALYQKAYELRPDLPEARLGMAFIRMNEGKLDEARELLDFLESPGAGQVYPLGPLETLATQYQKQGYHEQALEIFRHLIDEFPDAAKLHNVRTLIRKSEKAIGEKILPEQDHSWLGVFNPWNREFSKGQRTVAFGGLVLFLVIAGMLVNIEYVRRHRTLHVLSGLDQPVTVQVDGEQPVQVRSHEKLTVSEGSHRISVTGPVTASYDIDMHSGYWDRLFNSPVWAVNVAGTAPLAQFRYIYAQNPPPPGVTLLVGKTFVALPDIDYAFVEPPGQLELPQNQGTLTKSGVMVLEKVEPDRLALHIQDPEESLRFMEAHLPLRPDDALLFHTYLYQANQFHQKSRAEDFLKAGLERRPVEINWHRVYQEVLEDQGRIEELVRLYDQALGKEPQNGQLEYLRARIEDDPAKAKALLERAKKDAPDSPWPYFALAYQALSRADWRAGFAEYNEAEKRGLDPLMIRHYRHVAELAMNPASIVTQCRANLQQKPNDGAELCMLVDALVCQGQAAAARQELSQWRDQRQQLITDSASQSAFDETRYAALYELGDLSAMKDGIESSSDPELLGLKFHYFLAAGHPERVASDPSFASILDEHWNMLALSVALESAGKRAEAATWRDKATSKLAAGSIQARQAARMLTGEEPPSDSMLQDMPIELSYKLVLMAALHQKFPADERILQLGRKLNVSRAAPYLLVARVLGQGT